jgi:hypothetical protein
MIYFLTSLITKYHDFHSSANGMSLHHHLRIFLMKQSRNMVTENTGSHMIAQEAVRCMQTAQTNRRIHYLLEREV